MTALTTESYQPRHCAPYGEEDETTLLRWPAVVLPVVIGAPLWGILGLLIAR